MLSVFGQHPFLYSARYVFAAGDEGRERVGNLPGASGKKSDTPETFPTTSADFPGVRQFFRQRRHGLCLRRWRMLQLA
jgi:hypothetical protein